MLCAMFFLTLRTYVYTFPVMSPSRLAYDNWSIYNYFQSCPPSSACAHWSIYYYFHSCRPQLSVCQLVHILLFLVMSPSSTCANWSICYYFQSCPPSSVCANWSIYYPFVAHYFLVLVSVVCCHDGALVRCCGNRHLSKDMLPTYS